MRKAQEPIPAAVASGGVHIGPGRIAAANNIPTAALTAEWAPERKPTRSSSGAPHLPEILRPHLPRTVCAKGNCVIEHPHGTVDHRLCREIPHRYRMGKRLGAGESSQTDTWPNPLYIAQGLAVWPLRTCCAVRVCRFFRSIDRYDRAGGLADAMVSPIQNWKKISSCAATIQLADVALTLNETAMWVSTSSFAESPPSMDAVIIRDRAFYKNT